MKAGDIVIVSKFNNDYYKATGKIVRLYTKIINTYQEHMALVYFENREILKVGKPLTLNPVEFNLKELSSPSDSTTFSSRFFPGAKVTVVNKDRTRTYGQEGEVIDSNDDMSTVQFPSGEEIWFMNSEIEHTSTLGDDW